MSKLNLGCAYNKEEGYINVDLDPECEPDLCFDLRDNWPIETDSVHEVLAMHILEHIEGTDGFLNFWKELYRVCCDGAMVKIEVPHWTHPTFFHDPTHVRAVTPIGIRMFDQEQNHQNLLENGRETKLGFMCKVDFSLEYVNFGADATNGDPCTCQYIVKAVKPARYRK